jgi:hypothetical protein
VMIYAANYNDPAEVGSITPFSPKPQGNHAKSIRGSCQRNRR